MSLTDLQDMMSSVADNVPEETLLLAVYMRILIIAAQDHSISEIVFRGGNNMVTIINFYQKRRIVNEIVLPCTPAALVERTLLDAVQADEEGLWHQSPDGPWEGRRGGVYSFSVTR